MKRRDQAYYDDIHLLKQYQILAMDEEINKMRKELFEIHKIEFTKNYEEKEAKIALEYFLATPSIHLITAKSFNFIRICFESARKNLKNQEGKQT